MTITITVLYLQQTAPLILRDGNGAIYPVAKDCLDGIRDPLWFDMAPLSSLSMAIQSLSGAGPPSKNRIAIIALALEVCRIKLHVLFLLSLGLEQYWYWVIRYWGQYSQILGSIVIGGYFLLF